MDIILIKKIVGIVAIILTFSGYATYVFDILKGKTRPHVISWFIWFVATSIVYGLQVSAGGGFGAFVTLAVAAISLFVFLLSFKNGTKNIKLVDVIFLFLAVSAIPLWLVAKQPVLSVAILSTIEMLGFLPTIRKSWNSPYSEALIFYLITTVRHSLSIYALANLNIVTVLYPATWVAANAIFSVILISRRQIINKK